MRYPAKKSYWLHNDQVYRVVNISSATDEIILSRIDSRELLKVRLSVFLKVYERVLKVTEVARMLNRHPRTIYTYERKGQIEKPKCFMDLRGHMLRFYRAQDVLDMYELLSLVHQGRPNKDGHITNNSMIDIFTFRKLVKEKYAR